jgi:glycosyltransferase involved in cell wall biosynthesis
MIEFAVVIPTYRRPELLAAAVDSILSQSYPPSEIVVVRDGPDALVPSAIDTKPVIIIDHPRAGVAAARNAGIAATSAEWVCFLDDDDLWHPDRLRLAAEHISTHSGCMAWQAASWSFATSDMPGVDLAASNLDECLAAADVTAPTSDMRYLDITGRSFDLLLGRNRGCISTATVRRDVLVKAGGFPAGYTCAEDWVMFINVARYTEWCYCAQRLSFVRKHAGNNTIVNHTNDIVTLRALHKVWENAAAPVPAHRPLSCYALDYRLMVQCSLWRAVGRRQVRTAFEVLREGAWLLPRARDRAVVLVPPAVGDVLSRLRSLLPGEGSKH